LPRSFCTALKATDLVEGFQTSALHDSQFTLWLYGGEVIFKLLQYFIYCCLKVPITTNLQVFLGNEVEIWLKRELKFSQVQSHWSNHHYI
jgi:hypothetical protein